MTYDKIKYDKFRKEVSIPVKATTTEVIARSSNRIETLDDLRADLERLSIYCRRGGYKSVLENRQKTPLSKDTLKTWSSNARNVFMFMGYIEYSEKYADTLYSKLEKAVESGRVTRNTMISYMVALQELYRSNWKPNILLPKPERLKPNFNNPNKFHTQDEISKLFRTVEGNTVFGIRDQAILTYAYYSASRNQEIGHLYKSDYDRETGTITIQGHGDWNPKNNKTRTIHLPDIAQQYLNSWLDLREQEEIAQHSSYVFTTANETPLDHDDLYSVIHKYAKKANLESHPHKLRHSRCSHLLNVLGWPPTVVQAFMGHESLATTMTYCHYTGKEQKEWLTRTQMEDILI